MKGVYFHLVGGASGDMLLMSLIHLGCPLSYLKREFTKLNIKFSIKEKEIKGHCHTPRKKLLFTGSKFTYYKDIVKVIQRSSLSKDIKDNALRVYRAIADAEEKAHKPSKNLHFHHLGEIDAILEICGFFIALKYLNIGRVYVSSFPLAMPSAATLALLRHKEAQSVDLGYETVTPTAAALLMDAGQKREFSYEKYALGWGGAGDIDYLAAYLLKENGFDNDEVIKIETNIDDMSPQMVESLYEVLYKKGAKEVYLAPALMKKMRPAYVLNVLCCPGDFDGIREIIFRHTTTFGIRYQVYQRDKLKSRFIERKTKFGKIRFRRSLSEIKKETPEYQDCKKAAEKFNVPLLEVYREVTT